MHIKKTLKIVPLLTTLLLAACGGGGSGSEDTEADTASNGYEAFTADSQSAPRAAESMPAASSHLAASSSSQRMPTNSGYGGALNTGSQNGARGGESAHSAASSSSFVASGDGNPVPGDFQRPVGPGASASSSSQYMPTNSGNGGSLNTGSQYGARGGDSAHSAASSSSFGASGYDNQVPGGFQRPVGTGASSSSSSQRAPTNSGNGGALNAGSQYGARGGDSAHSAASSSSFGVGGYDNQVPGGFQRPVGTGASSSSSSQRMPTNSGNSGAINTGSQYGAQVGGSAHSASSSSSSSSASSRPVKPSSVGTPEALVYALQTGDSSVVTAKQVMEAVLADLRSSKIMPPDLSREVAQEMLQRLDKGTFSTTWSGCHDSYGRMECEEDKAYMDEFGSLIATIRRTLRDEDSAGVRVFGDPKHRFEQYMVLLGDKYRQEVSYGEHFTKESDKAGFMRALFSDAVSYMSRDYNAVAKNLGSFSGIFPDTLKTIEREVRVTPPATSQLYTCPFDVSTCDYDINNGATTYATGLYVLPGRSVTLTRTDTGSGVVRFGINMLRDTTHAFSQLNRPTKLASPRPVLKPGESVTVTSSYGGPLFLFMNAAPGQPDVSLRISGVITHPLLRNPEDPAAVEAFKREVASTPTNWVIMETDFVTVHTTVPKLKQALTIEEAGPAGANYHGDLQKLIADTWTYFVKIPYELAGFNSASGKFSLAPEVRRFCDAHSWDCSGEQHRREVKQHVIADIPFGGSGAAGNPYDQDWPFEPLGWGESHEVGHNLQRKRLNIYGGNSGEVSNNIFPLYKHIRYNQDPAATKTYEDVATVGGGDPKNCPNPNATIGKCVFDILQKAKAAGNSQLVFDTIWSDAHYAANGDQRLTFYRQLVEFARHYRAEEFKDGWELYTLLYLLDRDIENDKQNWATVRNKYGFGAYQDFPEDMDGNDFMLMASSFIIGRDMRPVFRMWGITWTEAASAQVDAYQLQAAEEIFFPMRNMSAAGNQVGTPVQVTPSSVYPGN